MVADTTGANGAATPKGLGHDLELLREPLKYCGSLDKFEYSDLTTIIGREFSRAQLTDWMRADDADVLLRDLAITSTYLDLHYYRL